MGQKASTGAYSGFLEGASVPAPPGVILPAPPQRPVKVTIPQPQSREQRPLKPGDQFAIKLADDRRCMVRVPPGSSPGQQVQMLLPEYHKMVASTLHAPPIGFKVLSQKPIVVANISYQIQGPTKEQASSQQVASLMQAAQNELLRQAYAAACNAVLGIGFSVTTTSSTIPGQGSCTLAMVSAFGTPCTIGKDGAYPGIPGGPHPQQQAAAAAAAAVPTTATPTTPPAAAAAAAAAAQAAAASPASPGASAPGEAEEKAGAAAPGAAAAVEGNRDTSPKEEEFAEVESVMGVEVTESEAGEDGSR